MIKLNSYKLANEPALNYFKKNLDTVNILSSQLLKLVNFESGFFFTLLPESINKQKIYEFSYGGVATGHAGEIRNQTINLTQNKLNEFKDLSLFFDDVNEKFEPDLDDPLYLSYGMFYQNEIYFFISQKDASFQIIKDFFYISNATWHSLCVLSKTNNQINKKLTLEEINNICLNAQLIVVGAYDAEGYVIWEKTNNTPPTKTNL